jgi:hypothetical protein
MLLDVPGCGSIAIEERLSLRTFHQGFVRRGHGLSIALSLYPPRFFCDHKSSGKSQACLKHCGLGRESLFDARWPTLASVSTNNPLDEERKKNE